MQNILFYSIIIVVIYDFVNFFSVTLYTRRTTFLAKETVKQQAYNYIKNKIICCEFQPGTFLDEKQIALDLGVSRTPIRDAVNLLAKENLVIIAPKKGVIVSKITPQDIFEVFQVREIIEPTAVSQFSHNLSTEKLREFKEIYFKCDFDEETGHRLDDEFHKFIIAAYKNEYMNNVFLDLQDKNKRIRKISGSLKTGVNVTYNEHLNIINLIENMDTELAAKELLEHIKASKRRALERFI